MVHLYKISQLYCAVGWVLHQAVEFGPACPQPLRFFGYQDGIVQVDEDCLYLNVYSPDVGSGRQTA